MESKATAEVQVVWHVKNRCKWDEDFIKEKMEKNKNKRIHELNHPTPDFKLVKRLEREIISNLEALSYLHQEFVCKHIKHKFKFKRER